MAKTLSLFSFGVLLAIWLALSPAESAINLSEESFKAELEKVPFALVKFFTPWCGHCKNMAPEYSGAALELAKESTLLTPFEVNCDDSKTLCAAEGIQGYPTLRVYKNGVFAMEYPQTLARTKADIVAFVKKGNSPSYSTIESAEALEKFMSGDRYSILGVVNKDDTKSAEAFIQAADAARFDAAFALTFLPGHEDVLGSTRPTAVAIKTGDERSFFGLEEFSAENIVKFAKSEKIPIFGKLDESTFQSYVDAAYPLALVFLNPKDSLNALEAPLSSVAKKYRNKLSVVWLDAEAHGSHSTTVGLSGQKFPCVAVHDLQSGLKYPFSESAEITEEALDSFFGEILGDKIKPFFKSEPVPAFQEGPVFKMVHDSFEQTATNNDKDILLMISANWCQFCKKFYPLYAKLAEAYSPQSDKIILAKLDLDANDLPKALESQVNAIPALFFFPARSSGSGAGIKFAGTPNVAEVARFIAANARNPLEKADLPLEESAFKPSAEYPGDLDGVVDEGFYEHEDL